MVIFRPVSGIVSDLPNVPTRLFASLRGFLLLLLLLCACEGDVVLSFGFESSLFCSLSLALSLSSLSRARSFFRVQWIVVALSVSCLLPFFFWGLGSVLVRSCVHLCAHVLD